MRRFASLVLVPVALVMLLVGCGSSSSTKSKVSKADFCAANATLDKATASVKTPAQLLEALKSHQSAIDEFAQSAPSAINAQAQVLVKGANAAIKANSVTAFNTQTFATAGQAVDTYCGEQANGSASPGSSTTTT
jgi:hypothetical protein